jgi:hypothetical protein
MGARVITDCVYGRGISFNVPKYNTDSYNAFCTVPVCEMKCMDVLIHMEHKLEIVVLVVV